ncbi:MAG: hypothetical protein IPJ85_07100 [Flavobacteriales bacterium]|nr:hypothetical protein [Flavobacteriales bacterium]
MGNLITQILGSAFLSGGLVYLLIRTYLTEQIKASIKYEYDQVIERLREQIRSGELIATSSIGIQSQGALEAHKERLKAIQSVWDGYLKVRDSVLSVSSWDSSILESEFASILSSREIKQLAMVKNLLQDADKAADTNYDLYNEVSRTRAFLNERIWHTFSTYYVAKTRVHYLYSEGCRNGVIMHWKHDKAIRELLEHNLTREEVSAVYQKELGGLTMLGSVIEQKLLAEFHRITTGREAADNTLEQAKRLADLSRSASPELH